MFNSLIDVLNINFKKSNFSEIDLPLDFQEYRNKDSKYIIKNHLFESDQYRRWRVTTLDGGDKLQVFNTVAYPKYTNEKPILGVDVLWFGVSKKLLAVLDFQPLIQNQKYIDKYCSGLKLIKAKYSNFDNQKMKDIYDSNKYFSPWVIICRGNKSNLDKDLNKVFKMFLDEYLNMDNLIINNHFLSKEEIRSKHIEYNRYSAEKDPAEKLFKTFFGKFWTEKFVKDFLFTLT
tara:strand:+ start:17 stop:712 length:696 start_codon:yes stop_codon:yes gene_type:complete